MSLPTPTAPPFEPACLRDLWGLPPDEIFAAVIARVRTEVPRLCAAAADSLAAGRRAELERHAHTLKGAAGNVCALRLAALAAALTEAAATAPPALLTQSLASVVEEWRLVEAVIDAGGPYG